MTKRSLPFVGLDREQWGRLGNAAALFALALVAVLSSTVVYLYYGHDFRGYYAAARVTLAGGDPYDYRQVADVLLGDHRVYGQQYVTLLAFVLLAFVSRHTRRKALAWMLLWLGALVVVGTLVLPEWLACLWEPGFGRGLTWLTDGPGRVLHRRRLCLFWARLESDDYWLAVGMGGLLALLGTGCAETRPVQEMR